MGATTGIEWTQSTWNPVRGCTRVSEGCRNCYAEVMAARFSGKGQWGEGFAEMKGGDHRWTGKVELIESQLGLPLRWKKPRRIFVNSTSDLFHEKLSFDDIDRIFAVMALCDQHVFQILTKRPERMRAYCTPPRLVSVCRAATRMGHAAALVGRQGWPLPNVWAGTSVEDQERADERIPHLLATPAAVRFLSCEPLLGPLDLAEWFDDARASGDGLSYRDSPARGLGWVIVGGESGPDARPFDIMWASSIVAQCKAAGVACFVKQLGKRPYDSSATHLPDSGVIFSNGKGDNPAQWPEELRVREFPEASPCPA